jgi:hypothetical protein
MPRSRMSVRARSRLLWEELPGMRGAQHTHMRFLAVLIAALGLWLASIASLPAQPPPVALPETAPTPAPASPSPPATPLATPAPRLSVDGMRIILPRLRIDLPLAEGDVGRDVPRPGFAGSTPEGAAFHFPGTAVPGELGNAYIYSHARPGMFLALWNVRVDDDVIIRLSDGTELRYRISEVHPRVAPTDTSWLQPTAEERLTLQTSTGPVPENPRFVAVARRTAP